jgi:hypothetical protein
MVADVVGAGSVEPEDLSVNIKNSGVAVTTVTEKNCVNTHDVVSTVWSVKAVKLVFMAYALYVVTNVAEEIAVHIKETRTGAFSVQETECVHADVSDNNAFHAVANEHATTEKENQYVSNALQHTYVSMKSRKISVSCAIQNLHVFMIDFVYNVSSVTPKSPASTVDTSISPNLVGNPTASVATVSSIPMTLSPVASV